MKRAGTADLALMGGSIPPWLFERMTQLSGAMVEAILVEQGAHEFLRKMSNPFWFQSFGAVIGMDWNSSGVTTAVVRALKRSVNPHAREWGIYVCGGKGKHSIKTPEELMRVGDQTGLDGHALARCSKLSAKVDNTAIQDGFQVYLHSFVVSAAGDWTVVQQGMKPEDGTARRYHWHSENLRSFVEEPHAAICGDPQGTILNLTDRQADANRDGILALTEEKPQHILQEIPHMRLPKYCDIRTPDVDLKRLGSVLWLAQEAQTTNFEELLLLKGLGPRTLQSLSLVSEVLHGAPARFSDPARFAFAHGGKSGRPFPVPTQVYDETIQTLRSAVDRARMGHSDKQKAIAKLSALSEQAETHFTPKAGLDELMEKEQKESWKYGGRTAKSPAKPPGPDQLRLFEE